MKSRDNRLHTAIIYAAGTLLSVILISSSVCMAESLSHRAMVYGGTPAGIMAAYSAAKTGLKVILVEPTHHVGGTITSGLTGTDACDKDTVAGLARDFFSRVGTYYQKPIAWNFEPHVAEKVFLNMLAEVNVTPHYGAHLVAVEKSDGRIISATLSSGETINADVFIDASYEGDLLAKAAVPYSVGREPRAEFGEAHAGAVISPDKNQFSRPIRGTDERGALLRGVHLAEPPVVGSGDKKSMAYCYRLSVCTDPAQSVPVAPPPDYDPLEYELLAQHIRGAQIHSLKQLFTWLPSGRDKYDLNTSGPFSLNAVGESWNYPDADVEERSRIQKAHERYTRGLIHFLQTDKRLPKDLRTYASRIGLCKDEFTDNGNWPYQLYIRAARRMRGSYILRESDLTTPSAKPDSIALASCPIETHSVQRFVDRSGNVVTEGNVHFDVPVYQIPYSSIVPKPGDADNLLVPVAVSATNIAYSSLRMEPVFMALGQAAGIAASLAVEAKSPVQRINVQALQQKLKDQGARFSLPKR